MALSRFLLRMMLGKRLPITSGTLSVEGLHDGVTIRRDRWGVPYISAQSERDAAFGIGFCHGQDRTFQLEVLNRVVHGTLSEAFGERTLAVDRLSRRIGFRRSAEQQLELLDDEMRAYIEAYAAGARAGSAKGLASRPHEFVLFRGQPTPWSAVASLGVVKLLSFTLATNWDAELARWKILLEDGEEALKALHPYYPDWHPTSLSPNKKAGAMIDRLSEELAKFHETAKVGGGSNNWVIAGSQTATGRPIVASDPHLDARIPGHWYLAQVRTPTFEGAGGTFVGGPSFLVGHNGHAAWSPTAGFIDNTDLFREEIGTDGVSVREGETFVPCEVCEETIAVKGRAPVVEKVLITKRGPIVSPALPDVSTALSLRAVWLDPLPLRGMITMQKARSFAEFREECKQWPATSQNLVYADTTGTVGWQMIGQAPQRRKGSGYLPRPGWDPEWAWESELLPFEHNPWTENPPEGFLATANAIPLPQDEGKCLSVDWLDGYRLTAIQQRLEARTDWDVASTLALQMDRRTPVWDELRAIVQSLPTTNPDADEALSLLRDWDGELSDDSAAGTVFELFLVEIEQRLAKAKAPNSSEAVLGMPYSPFHRFNLFGVRRTAHLVRLLREQPSGWFSRSWPDECADALASVMQQTRKVLGPDVTRWGWGKNRTLTLHHPLGTSRWLASIFNRGPFPYGGDTNTINQAASLPLKPLAPTDNLASMRAVIDVGAWSNSRFSLPGGQSGNPLSPHYDDILPLWLTGEGIPIAWSDDEIQRATVQTLTLTPASDEP